MSRLPRLFLITSCLLLALSRVIAAPVINEIMFHPPGSPGENVAQEWIEILNPDAAAVNVSGWKLTKGVNFTIPATTTIPAGGYLVIAANVATFNVDHPGFTGQVIGGWTGRLSNSGEQIQLDDATGTKVNDVSYADEGDWALRGRGELSFSHRGWDWFSEADGGGKTLELRNPALGNGNGQNWGVSTAAGGSPGAVNSVASANRAPLIKDVKHRPEIPRTTDPIVVSCNLEDEAVGATATLRWRVDGAGSFNTLAMSDTDGDGDVEATIPAQTTNLTVIEWYISATDGTLTRTWPAPARTSFPGVLPETFGQVANALVQVDNNFDPNATFTAAGSQPWYRVIMTETERAELQQIGDDYSGKPTNEQNSEAKMNATFISHDGTGIKTVYLAGVRNRGGADTASGSPGSPNNYNVSFRSDDLWNDRASIALNGYYPHSQVLGNSIFDLAGIPPQEPAIVRLRVNGVDLAETGSRMYGRYVRLEGRNGEWAERHYPNDSEGNFYRLDDHAYPQNDTRSGELRWEGPLASSYSDTFIKETNQDANDYSDIMELARVISAPQTGGTAEQPAIPDSAYVAAVSAKFDLDAFYRFIAVDALIGNQEGGLQSGRADDVSMYRGLVDTRFRLIPHDMDDVFDLGIGVGNPITRSLFSYVGEQPTSGATGVDGFARLFSHPQLVPRYYAAVLEALNTYFTHATLDPHIDRLMTGWVAPAAITGMKAFIDSRRANVLTQIPQGALLLTNNPAVYTLNVTAAGTAVDGNQRTNDGAATFSGTFNVAKTYSVTVNGVAAQWFYRTVGADAAGSWKLVVPAGGGGVLSAGLNTVVVRFWDAPGGTGGILQELTAKVLWQPAAATYTNVSGTLNAGSLRLIAPASYIPGKPFLVRVDLLDAQGNINRNAWDSTIALSSSAAGVTLPSVQLYNGMGSALCTAGGSGGGGTTILVQPGGTSQAPNASAPDWRMLYTATTDPAAVWKSDQAFNDTAWALGKLQGGAGDGDERTNFTAANVDTAQTTRRAFYFRRIFNVADPTAFTQLLIKAVVDDGAVFYLNGTQVYVDNMPGGTPTLTTPAASNRSGAAETQIRTFDISAFLNLLVPGDNLLAVEVHNYFLASPLTNSADLSFDCELDGVAPATDPGNFTLTASGAGFTAQKAMTSLTSSPTITTATGTLPTGTTNWSGVIQVTGDVTVPAAGTLNIAAGTHVLMDGDAIVGGHAGKKITVNGALNINGTAASPVNITATNSNERWGQLVFANAQPSTCNYALISNLGRGPTSSGHTGRTAMISLNASVLTLNDSVFGDGPGKALLSSGNCTLTIERSLINRVVTGPELNDNCGLFCEDSNIQFILPNYREDDPNTGGNEAAPDDEDCMYVHNGSARSVILRRSVFARCGDDLFDCLGGPITVEDSILREGWDKGMSLLNNDLTISRTQIIQCDKAIAHKNSATPPDTKTVTATNVTIVSENHDTSQAPWGYPIAPSNPDPDTPSTGFYTQNKAGQSNTGTTLSFIAKNCIVIAQSPVLVDAPYDPANSVVTYSDLTLLDFSNFTWPGNGNISTNPLFVAAASGNYNIAAASPCRDTGDPTTFDPDLTRADMGALPYTTAVGTGTITWTPAGGPYRLTAATTVPNGTTLNIQAGTAVYFDQNVRLTVNGNLQVLGTPNRRVTFSYVPGTVAAGDCDPIKNLTQTGPPKWGGIRVYDSMAAENVVKYADFINAQGIGVAAPENYGSIGFIRSWGYVEGCTWSGTHLRMCYGRNSKLTVIKNNLPDMFIFDATLGRIENPTDFIAAADNNMEPLKVEFPTTDPEVSGNPNYPNGLPINGHWRVYYNDFHGNRGHQDVFDADSGRWAARDANGNQTNGQFMLDCRYNTFHGLTGDEHIDLGGDAFIADNIFYSGSKDQWTIDSGYANAISSGDKGSGTTIMVARNLFYDLDHAINCKINTATIFEHNTCVDFHQDWQYNHTVSQFVACSAVNLYVPNDGNAAGDGGFLAYNIFYGNVPAPDDTVSPDPPGGFPRLYSWPDQTTTGATTSVIRIENNFIDDRILDTALGVNHPGGIFAPAWGFGNVTGNPLFVDKATRNFALQTGSPARGTAAGGLDYGATVAEWAYILGGPTSTTASTSASFTIGGPGMVTYKWRLDGGVWSAPIQIGAGGVMPRTGAIVRQATLNLTSLAAGSHTLEVLGQDMAGNWQDADPARTVIGATQAAPTGRTWTIDTANPIIRINEVLADSATLPDTVELTNLGANSMSLAGWTLTDDPAVPAKVSLNAITIPAGGYATVTALSLDRNGDTVYLYQGATLRDSIAFGNQIADLTIGRVGASGAWTLCTPTLGAANVAARLGDQTVVRLNEWFTSGDVLYDDDWIELVNPSALPIDLGGLHITDNRSGDPLAHTFGPLTFIAANGFARFLADGNPEDGPSHLSFSLDAQQESIALLDASGATIDVVFYYPQTTDRSMGRDAGGNLVFYELPTRGFLNGTSDPAYANALALLRGLRITEIMFNAVGGSDFDYVELRNVGATPLALGGVHFVQGIDFTFPAMTLNAGQNVLVVKHLAKFRSRYGNAPIVAGVYSGQLDNGGETLGLQLPPPFDANVLTFRYEDTWYLSTDGGGTSLVVPNPLVNANIWGDKDTWVASGIGGNPDGASPTSLTFSGWSALHGVNSVSDDGDKDGAAALIEFELGMSNENPNGANGQAGLPAIGRAPDGRATLSFLVPENAAAVQNHGFADVIYNVQAASAVGGWTTIATKSFGASWSGAGTATVGGASGGFVPVTITDTAAPGTPQRFLRLQAVWVP